MSQPLRHGGLPTLRGVSPSCVGLPAGPWATFTDFLVQRFTAISRATWQARMAAGCVVDEFGTAITPEQPYRAHLRLYYYRDVPAEPRIPFEAEILYQDAHLLVVDKPHFLPVTPSGHYLQETLLVRLKNQLDLPDLVPIHRLDRDTAGLLLLCPQPAQRDAYQALFRTHQIDKCYEAIAPWQPALSFPLERRSRIVADSAFFRQTEVSAEPGSELNSDATPNSLTHIDVREVQGAWARYALRPVTGQKHQLRVHMSALGMPILNDRLYPRAAPAAQADDYARPLQLLAQSLRFTDPLSGAPQHFETRLRLHMPAND